MNFNKILVASFCALVASCMLNAAPPQVMVLPDDQWCIENKFYTVQNKRGKETKIADYERAFKESRELVNVVPAIGQLLGDMGLKLINFASQNDSDDEDDAVDEFYEGAESGAGVESNSLDAILNKFKPDITLRLGWNVNQNGFDYNCSYRLVATDAYSNKEIAAVTSETAVTKRSVPVQACIKNAVAEHMNDFAARLNEHKEDMGKNGREISINVGIISGSGINMNTEFGGKELGTIIYDWISDNTVNHQFQESSSTRNRLRYKGVRIPMEDSSGRPIQAKQFVTNLQKYLQSNYGIRAENVSSGLGKGRLMIGEK